MDEKKNELERIIFLERNLFFFTLRNKMSISTYIHVLPAGKHLSMCLYLYINKRR